jgi:hypothetical protein
MTLQGAILDRMDHSQFFSKRILDTVETNAVHIVTKFQKSNCRRSGVIAKKTLIWPFGAPFWPIWTIPTKCFSKRMFQRVESNARHILTKFQKSNCRGSGVIPKKTLIWPNRAPFWPIWTLPKKFSSKRTLNTVESNYVHIVTKFQKSNWRRSGVVPKKTLIWPHRAPFWPIWTLPIKF